MGRITALMLAMTTTAMWLAAPSAVQAQGGRGGRGGPPPSAKASAPIDLAGYWTAVITEDYRLRMFTTPKGDFGVGPPGAVIRPGTGAYGQGPNPSLGGSIPYQTKGAQAAMQWDPVKDEAEGNQCKAYGALGVMRQPTHLHISWQDDNTLKVEADAGTQTRLFHFIPPPQGQMSYASSVYMPPEAPKFDAPPGTPASWQGYSVAIWTTMGGDRENYERSGSLKVVTSRLRPGYYWRNGMPYTENALLTEHFRTLKLPDGGTWIILVQIVDDPEYLTQPFIVNYHFKKLPDGSQWNPTACLTR